MVQDVSNAMVLEYCEVCTALVERSNPALEGKRNIESDVVWLARHPPYGTPTYSPGTRQTAHPRRLLSNSHPHRGTLVAMGLGFSRDNVGTRNEAIGKEGGAITA